jgi:ParB-like chromosome segregation protein Spo0J
MSSEVQIPPMETVDLSLLKVDGQNPNRMSDRQKAALRDAIARYGFIVPIITNMDYLIADGEQRLEAARSLGMKQAPVIRLPIKDVDRRILRQIMNKLKGEQPWLWRRSILTGRVTPIKATPEPRRDQHSGQ